MRSEERHVWLTKIQQQNNRPGLVNQHGVALLSVLWVVTILSLLAGSLVASQRSSTDTTRQWLEQAQARYAAEAAIHLTLYNLLSHQLQPSSENTEAIADEPPVYSGFKLYNTVYSEAGKADINQISDPLLRKIMQGVIDDPQLADTLTDRILDWRDGDELVRLNGAERRDYLSANRPFLPTNQPFKSVSELQRVTGMTTALFLRLQPLITIYSGQNGIDMAAARPEMLTALGVLNNQPRRFFNAASSRILEITSRVEKPGLSGIQLRSTIALQPGNIREPFHILTWDFAVPGLTEMTANLLPEQGRSNATE
ncbi:type II secretion system minor pseudopilin [Amphritea pacifica]|uniref:General secretion pathway protein GspK n=1 Tax=Amphritea pacifica TaxID=2811233 RepID=A0ABS2W7D4_9GAMM|nr:type II secretion system protein GspK [Amphritea pacifica]MBN0987536.1 general secretion pathway protein GspK [Amphritea pacifica]